jgi:dienelactone hydrolase
VVCKNSPDQSYALYLPSNYSSSRTWPLVAAFDPAARGNAAVETFKEAAERYGYIVCGSNNSRNGPIAPTGEAAKAMLGDVGARFAIDDKRVYLTGLSGGARAATTLAVWLEGRIAGVIGCGAGLAQGLEPSSLPFIYYGTVGDEDFNYSEMKRLDQSLEAARVTHHIEVFDGAHSWAPSEVCVHAIEWLELQAMKSGRRSRDDSFIDRLFKKAQQSASENESAGRVYEAYAGYAGIAADFKDLRDTAEFAKKSAVLKESKAVKQTLARERDQENQQNRMVSELFTLWARLRNPATSPALSGAAGDSDTSQTAFSDLKSKLADLKRKSEAKQRSAERALASRGNSFLIASYEEWRGLTGEEVRSRVTNLDRRSDPRLTTLACCTVSCLRLRVEG